MERPENRTPRLALFLVLFAVLAAFNRWASAEGGSEIATCNELEYSKRVTCLKTVLENSPCDIEALLTLTWLMAESNEWEDLMSLLAHLGNTAPEVAHFFQMRAQILVEHYGSHAEAEIELKKSEGLLTCFASEEEEMLNPLPPIPENAEKILERANTKYQRFRDYGGASRDFETYLSLVERPRGPSVFRHLAGARRQLGDIPGAIDALSLQMEVFPETAISVLPTRARLYREIGDEGAALADTAELQKITIEGHQSAIARLDESIAARPDDVSAYLERGTLKLKIGDYDGAIQDANQAMVVDPSLAAAYELRAQAQAQQGNLDGAKADRERSFELRRKERGVHENREHE